MNNIGKIFNLGDLLKPESPEGVYAYVSYKGTNSCIKGEDGQVHFVATQSLKPSSDIKNVPHTKMMFLGSLKDMNFDAFAAERFKVVFESRQPTWTVETDLFGPKTLNEDEVMSYVKSFSDKETVRITREIV
jgi:hypothetical protein